MQSILHLEELTKKKTFSTLNSAPELTIVIPTFNEVNNIAPLIEKIKNTLKQIHWEIVFVDDNSPDGTAATIKAIAQDDRRIRCIKRIGRRGLSGACIEGALSSQANFIAIMDGDLQHDETILFDMLMKMRTNQYDLIVGTRYETGGSAASFSAYRARLSTWGNQFVQRFLNVSLSDPMSGFFMLPRKIIDQLAPKLRTQGFKILIDIITSAKTSLRILEIPYFFRKRENGNSKLDTGILFDFVSLLIQKLSFGFVSARFILFSFVGSIGLALHILLLNIALNQGMGFQISQALITLFIVAYNFMLNNILTYGDQRLVGKQFLTGLIRFELLCSIGALSNVGVANWFYDSGNSWWIAGLSGALMGAIWNYLTSALYVWKKN